MSECKHTGTCSTCPYEYCIDEERTQLEQDPRKEYFEKYFSEKRDLVNQSHRDAYQRKKAAGICIRCNRNATHGLYCYDHFIEQQRRRKLRADKAREKRHKRGLIPEKRAREGLCLWCGEKASGNTQACEQHRKIFTEAARKKGRNYWNSLNDAMFRENTCRRVKDSEST